MKNKVIIITGPTGVGKSNLSIQIAKVFNGEIISADSCQVYKGFDIGSAKITESEKQGVCHHLIDICSPDHEYSAGDFAKHAEIAIDEIKSKKKIPIIVGGTGLYINSLLFPLSTDAKRDENYRKELEEIAKKHGKQYLHDMLASVDPKSAEMLSVNQTDRVIRALEIFKQTGIRKSELMKNEVSNYDYLLIVLVRDREEVYKLINSRVDKMIESGLIDEVKSLLSSGISQDTPAMKAIGYKEIVAYLRGEMDLSLAVDLIKQKSRNYAKRQITYFKKMKDANFVNFNDKDKIFEMINDFLKEND